VTLAAAGRSRMQSPHSIEADDVRQAVRRTGWLSVLSALAGDALGPALQRPGRHVACPVHDGRHGDGFRLFADVDRSGGGICATCGAYPDGLALLRWLFRWSFPEALAQIASVLGLGSGPSAMVTPVRLRVAPSFPRSIPEKGDPARARLALRRTWLQSLAPQDPRAAPLRRYLASRGLAAALLDPRVVRLHPALGYWVQDADDRPRCVGRFPAMLALVADRDGRPASIHRTYLRADGTGKAPVPSPRKLMAHAGPAPLAGAAIRLFPAGPALGLAEGIETALAVRAITGMRVWACVSATLLRGFAVPSGVERLTVWADKDRSGAGEAAAAVLQARLGNVLDVRVRIPAEAIPATARGIDWADVWLRQRPLGQVGSATA